MTENEALQILDNVCSRVSLSREDHAKIQLAVEILKEAIRPPTINEEKK